MKYEDECEASQIPQARGSRYGHVPDLEDEELADAEELERQVVLQEWGPVLMLPTRGRQNGARPGFDEDIGLDWGAFSTVDFERRRPEFDKARYKADRLTEKLRDALIMLSIVSERLPRAKYRVLKSLKAGVIELEHIENQDMLALAKYHLQAKRLQKEIAELRAASWKRRQARLAEVLP